jgi:ubiquinone/menaquinone biosynthesis C-methylase UbiE
MESKIIRVDFDKLALWDTEGWGHNSHYHDYLLKQMAPNCEKVLEIGCGTGSFSRLLSQRAENVLALDLSPEMIRIAKQRSEGYSNIEYKKADVMECEFLKHQFDCIVSIATLHHLPLEEILRKIKAWLKPNGILLVLDLYEAKGVGDLVREIVAIPVSMFLKLKNTGRIQDPQEVREAWAEHGKTDTYLPVSTLISVCSEIIPGAIIRKHLLWRYSMIWEKNLELS